MNATMKADLERLDLQERDGVALMLIVRIVGGDPLKRPMSNTQLIAALNRELGLKLTSKEQSFRIAARLRRAEPPLLVPSQGSQGRDPGLAPSAAGKRLVAQWLKSGATLKSLGPSAP